MHFKKGRGAQRSVANRFNATYKEREYTDADIDEINDGEQTSFINVYPKSIVNKVTSPDLPMEYSMNPYQGCEHGCVYCYARNSHEYWGYGAGKDFEQKILIKRNAPEILARTLTKKNWVAKPIMLSGNTDCYQPIEHKEQITRQLLHVCLKYKHPVSIITKNTLVTRDIDILEQLAKDNLVFVNITITSLDEEIRQKLEPRTATSKRKLQAIQQLTQHNIPTGVMMAPIIPGLNNYEIFHIAKAAAENGASRMGYTIVRLNGHLGTVFTDWVHKAFPTKADKIISLIQQMHNGKLNNSSYGSRMTGEGKIVEMIHKQVEMARKKFYSKRFKTSLNCELHQFHKSNQLNLFQ